MGSNKESSTRRKNAITRLSRLSRNESDFYRLALSLGIMSRTATAISSFCDLQRKLYASTQSLFRPDCLLVGCDIDLGLGPLAGRDLALEQNVDLTVRATLHLRQVEVCQGEAKETSSSPNVTALATKVGLLCYVSIRSDSM